MASEDGQRQRQCVVCGGTFTACSPKEHLCDECYFHPPERVLTAWEREHGQIDYEAVPPHGR